MTLYLLLLVDSCPFQCSLFSLSFVKCPLLCFPFTYSYVYCIVYFIYIYIFIYTHGILTSLSCICQPRQGLLQACALPHFTFIMHSLCCYDLQCLCGNTGDFKEVESCLRWLCGFVVRG